MMNFLYSIFFKFRKPSNNSIFTKLYPNFKFTPLEEGLKETINWFLQNYKIIRK